MKKNLRTGKKALSVILSLIMALSVCTVALPGTALATDTYYVRVYLNIYDGANSDGYGNAYTVVTDPTSEFYGKPDDYKWDYGSSWSATDNSKGYDGEINMAGFTLFYDNDEKFETYDLSADLVDATTTLGNKWTSMDELTLENFADCENKIEKIYTFELSSMPSSLFWINDENNAVNGETSFGIHKITVAETETSQEHILWTGLSGSESYYECYYGTITPTGLITPWDDCPDATTYTFYKDYTTSAVGTWIDPFNAGDYNVYPVNNYLSGGVSAAFTVGNSGSQTNIDYVDVGNTNNYYINFTNHSTQDATITLVKENNKSLISGYSDGFTLASGQTRSFALNKSSMSGDGNYYDFSFWFKLDNVYNSDGTTQTNFYQAAGIGVWNTTDDLKEIGLPAGESSNKGFTLAASDIDVMNQFMVDKGILESSYLSANRTTPISFTYNYWLDNSEGMTNWSQTGLRMFVKKWGNYRLHFQPDAQGTMAIEGAIGNSDASLSIADLVTSYTSASDTFTYPDSSNRPWAYVGSSCKPQWDGTTSLKWGTLWDSGDSGYFRFCGNLFRDSTTSDPAKITFSNMTWVCPALWSGGTSTSASFSGIINVYVFDKTQLRDYVYNLGGLGANWAPMRTRFNDAQWNAYEIALKDAKEVLANQKTNQKAVTDAYNALYSATEALKAASSLKSQVAQVTYTQRASDYDSESVQTAQKYIIMPIGTETTVPAYDTYKYATTGDVVGKQSSNLKTNYSQLDTGINSIDYRYWKIDFAGVDEAVAQATDILNNRPESFSEEYLEKLYEARTAVSYFDKDADTWTPTHQTDISEPLAELNALLAHDSTEPAVHSFYDEMRYDAANHWYECEVCGYKYSKADHSLKYSKKDANEHTVSCSDDCGYTYTEGHDWDEGNVTLTPNCDNDGVKTFTCKDCGETKTEAITSEGHKYVITDLGDGTHISKCLNCGANETDAVAEAHTYTYTNNSDGTHTATCSVCSATETVAHTFANPVLVRPSLVDGAWVNGTYTYTCVCGETKTEPAERADYSELENALEELEELNQNENLTDDAKAEIAEAIEKAEALADNLVTSEQKQIDDLVNELLDVKADVEDAINEQIGIDHITEATSGIKVQFIEKTGISSVDSVQLYANGGFNTVRMRLSNGNADLPVTVTSVVADKAYIGDTDTADSATYNTATTLEVNGSKDLYIVAPADFETVGNITYTITYKIGSEDEGYLMDADGKHVIFTTKAYLYVKASAYNPYHFMDEKTGIGGVSKWDHFVEATNFGDFTLISENTAGKFSEKLETGTKWYSFGTAHTTYDYDEDGCQAGCTDTKYVAGDGHAATYGYFVDTSLAPTWQAAGFRLRIAETKESTYENAPLKSIRVANDQAFIAGIKGDDKTFTLTFYPSATGTQDKTWAITSTGTLEVATYANPDETNELLFGEHKNRDGFTENTVLALMTGEIPSGVKEAKFMLSPRIEFNGTLRSESVTMTSHIWLTSYDKGELRETIAAAEQAGFNSEYLDAEKYEAYEKALATAKEVLGKAETDQDEVDEATAALKAAISALGDDTMFVLTVTHSIRENADKNSTATDTQYDYYLVNGEITPALKAEVIALDTINKYDAQATLNVIEDTTHTYNYWYIDYSGVQDAIDAADAVINDTENGYSEEYKNKAEEAKEALEDILDGENTTTSPESQETVDNAIDALTELTNHSHVAGNIIVENENEATCEAEGSYDNVTYCTICGKELSRETITVDKAEHTPEAVPGKDATCEDTGLTEGSKCSVCGETLVAQESTGPNGHNYDIANAELIARPELVDGEWTTGEYEATCLNDTNHKKVLTGVQRADYSAFEAAIAELKQLAEYESFTDEVKQAILAYAEKLENGGELPLNLVADYTYEDVTLKGEQNIIDAFVTELTKDGGVIDQIEANKDNPEYIKPDSTSAEKAVEDAEALKEKLELPEDIDNQIDELRKELDKILEEIEADDNATAAEYQERLDAVEEAAKEILEKYAECETNGHKFGDATIVYPTYDAENDKWTQGSYSYTCEVCGYTKAYNYDRANYEAYDKALADLNTLLADATITDAAKADIREVIANNSIADNLMVPDQQKVDDAAAALKAEADNINNDTTGAYEKVDYTEYDKAVETYEALDGVMSDEDKATVEGIKAEIAAIPADGSKAQYQEKVDEATDKIKEINGKYSGCATGNHSWGAPLLTKEPTADEKGEYTETCDICGATQITKVDLADYSKFDEVVGKLEELLKTEDLTDEAKDAIEEALDKADELDKNLPADTTTVDGKEIEGGQDEIDALVAELEKTVTDTNSEIADGSALKPDYEAWEEAEAAYDALDKTNVKAEIITEAEALKAEIAGKQADDTLTQATATQDDIDEATARLNEIIAGIEDGSLKDSADYTEVDKDLADAKEKAENNDVTDGVKEDIQEIEDKLNEIRNDPSTNADDQDEIDALEEELEEIIAGIENGTLVKPDYEAWEEAETAYDALDKTNVKAEIITEAEALKAEIAGKQTDDTLTQATATQDDIDEATARLNEIIAGIEDGSLKDSADYTEVDKDLADAKEKAENNDVIDGVKEDIQEIEDKLNEIRNDPATNADDQDEIDALEEELEEIIAGIENGTLVKPDYEAWEEAETAYDALDKTNVKAEIITEAEALKAEIAGKQADDTLTQATATQDDIDNATARLNEIIAGIEDGTFIKVDYTEYDEAVDAYEALNGVMSDEDKATVEAIKSEIAEIPVDGSKAQYQDDIDEATDKIKEINGKYSGCANGNHSYESVVTKPTCTEGGYTTHTCKVCGHSYKDNETQADHKYKEIIHAPNCLKDGYTENICEVCGDTVISNPVAKLDHEYEKKVTAPTCTKQGYTTYTCSRPECRHTYKGDYTDSTGHSYEKSEVIEPTCTEKGYTIYKCTVCGDTYNADYIDAKGHTEIALEAVEATCKNSGLTAGSKCAECGKVIVAQQTIPALKHHDADGDGVCDNCGTSDIYAGCVCLCHNTNWFWHIIYLIIRLVWKIFNIHPVCGCGAVHY